MSLTLNKQISWGPHKSLGNILYPFLWHRAPLTYRKLGWLNTKTSTCSQILYVHERRQHPSILSIPSGPHRSVPVHSKCLGQCVENNQQILIGNQVLNFWESKGSFSFLMNHHDTLIFPSEITDSTFISALSVTSPMTCDHFYSAFL